MKEIEKLLDIMNKLRDPKTGCPWDLEQDFASIAPYTIEEAYEVADAIADGDFDSLRGELGDLLLQVVFHSQMASEVGEFSFQEVVHEINEKMLRRHPHVFGTPEEIAAGPRDGSWEAIKTLERDGNRDSSALAGVTRSIPALKRAQKLGERAATVGFDWPDLEGVRDKIEEELDEVGEAIGTRDVAKIEEELGDLLYTVVNMARHLEVDAEHALNLANRKFERRFRVMEQTLKSEQKKLSGMDLESMDLAWRRAKKEILDGS